MGSVITFNQILNEFKTIFENNLFIKNYRIGDIFEVDFNSLDKTVTYPFVVLIPQPSTLNEKSIDYSFSLVVMDLVDEDEFNEFEVWSDTEQIGFDVIAAINNNRGALKNWNFDYPITRTPFSESYNDRLAGWTFDLQTLSIPGNVNNNDTSSPC